MIQDIISGLTSFLADSCLSLLQFVFELIIICINFVLTPLIALFNFFVPNLNEVISSFVDFVAYFATIPITFFVSLIPPLTSKMIIVMLSLKISYYTLIYSYRAIVVVPNLIRRIKFW